MKLIRASAAAAILGVHRVTIAAWVRNGKLTPTLRAGDEALFDEAYIHAVADKRNPPTQKAA